MYAVRLNRYRAGRLLALAGAGVAASAVAVVVLAQSASGWDLSGASGGGGSSAQSPYALQGAIGPISGQSTGGTYKVASGFFGGGGTADKIRRVMPGVAADGIPGR